MKFSIRQILTGLLSIFLVSALALPVTNAGNGKRVAELDVSEEKQLVVNDELHLIFMREEEKLARDVYIRFSQIYLEEPESQVFFNIVESESRHTLAVLNVMETYGVEDPVAPDAKVGEFTSEQYGAHFEETFSALVYAGTAGYPPYPEDLPNYYVEGLLAALYVGAFIEELDMQDIVYCPHEVIDYDPLDSITTKDDCGMAYTNEESIERMLGNLLAGSENHLRGYVHGIEKFIGAGNYRAQYLTQEQVDEILGRGE